jgi:ribonuclease HI
MKKITLITDGACLGNPGPGGWAALLRYKGHSKHVSGGNPLTTNNQMELTAVIEGLKMLKEPCEVHILSDSRYVIDGFAQGWVANWKANGWKTAANKSVKNRELWIELDKALSRHKFTFEWVKGHSGHEDNEFVDELARQNAEMQQKAPTEP